MTASSNSHCRRRLRIEPLEVRHMLDGALIPTVLVPEDAPVDALAPTSAAELPADWNQVGFAPDGSWTSGTTAVGFDAGPLPVLASDQFDYRYELDVQPNTQDLDTNGTSDFWTGWDIGTIAGGVASASYTDTSRVGSVATDFGGSIWRTHFLAGDWTVEVGLKITTAASAEGGTGSIAMLLATNGNNQENFWLRVGRNSMRVTLPGGALQVIDTSDNTADFVAIRVARVADKHYVWRDGVLLNASLDAADGYDWAPNTVGSSGLRTGFGIDGRAFSSSVSGSVDFDYLRLDRDAAYAPSAGGGGDSYGDLIGADLLSAMYGQNASAFARIPFAVTDPAFDALTLDVKYDDGFVAYLNGTEVARRNAPGTAGVPLAFDASAMTERSVEDALVYEQIDITEHVGLLTAGGNVLAIQGLNLSAADSDFLLLPRLTGGNEALLVTATDPADGAFLSAVPSSMTVDFSLEVSAATLDAADLMIDTTPATAVTLLDADTAQFDVAAVGPGVHTVTIDAGAIEAVNGQPIQAYSGTFSLPSPPTLATLPATDVGPNVATPAGELTDTGGQEPIVTLYWGAADGGTVVEQWDHAVELGALGAGPLGHQLVGLMPETTYYYRWAAANAGGTTWADQSASLTTTAYANLAINEFLADNEGSLIDGDGRQSDWFELFNPTAAPVGLAGWHATDDTDRPLRWPLPDVVLDPGEYMVVFASGKAVDDYVDLAGYHHANFQLRAAGEYVGLMRPDGVVSSEHGVGGVDYPQQLADVSYGFAEGGIVPPSLRFFTTPTPGAANGAGVMGITTDEVLLSHAGGAFVDPFSLTLDVAPPDAAIHYTLDGTAPTGASPVYSDPIPVNGSVQLRARAIQPGFAPGPIAAASFVHLAADVQAFTSPLPILVIENFGAGEIPGKGYSNDGSGLVQVARQPASMLIFDRVAGQGALADAPALDSRIGIRIRGSSAALQAKKSFSVESWDQQDDDANIRPFGMPAESDWVLYGPTTYDTALIHNTYMFELSNQVGRYAPRLQFVEAFLHTDGGSLTAADHAGLYVLMEKVKRDDDRVAFDELSADATTGGWMLQVNRMDPAPVGGVGTPNHFHTPGPDGVYAPGPYGAPSSTYASRAGDDHPEWYHSFFNFENPNGYEINATQEQTIKDYLLEMESVLYGPDFADPATGYPAYFDVDSFIDYYILQNLPKNNDAIALSTYIYTESPTGKLKMGPIWDFDRSLDYRSGGPTAELNFANNRLWYGRLFDDPEFVQRYVDRWQELRRGPLSTANIHAVIDAQAAEITEPVALANGTSDWPAEIAALKDFLAQRATAIDAQYVAPPTFSSGGGQVDPGFEVVVDAPGGTIYYTTDGSDPRAAGGGVASGAIELTNQITETLIAPGAAAAATVPDATTGPALALTWTDPAFDDAAWPLQGVTGVGYEEAAGYEGLIGLNVGGAMFDVHTSVYTRIEFDIVGPVPAYDFLDLQMKYDDGFVAYLNGQKVADFNAPATPDWASIATDLHNDAAAVVYEHFDLTPYLHLLEGDATNVLAIHGLNRNVDSSDLLILPELTAGFDVDASVVINDTTQLVARALDGGDWSGSTEATFLTHLPAAADNVAISEIHFNPAPPTGDELLQNPALDNDDFEFIELTNIAAAPVYLGGVQFEPGSPIAFSFADDPASLVAPGESVLVVKNLDAFRIRYGTGLDDKIAGAFTAGGMNNGGEAVTLLAGDGGVIRSFSYDDRAPWPSTADGLGFSLVLKDPASNPDHANPFSWRASAAPGGSPGAADPTGPAAIVVNEALSNSDGALLDSIELFNPTGGDVNLGGWFLTDDENLPQKYQIADPTIIPAGGYLTFDETQFNAIGDPNAFALSATGDEVFLFSADPATDALTGYMHGFDFGAAANNVAFIRHVDSTGYEHFVAQANPGTSLGGANESFRVGEVIVTELHYNPKTIDPLEPFVDEFIEIQNVSDADVPLLDPDNPANTWVVNGAAFAFPPSASLAPGEVALVVAIDPELFRTTYSLPAELQIFGPFFGSLSDGGETISLQRPTAPAPETPLIVPLIDVDAVRYDDDPPWTTLPDGGNGDGSSLNRVAPDAFGSEPQSWTAAEPTPGAAFTIRQVVGRHLFYNDSAFDAPNDADAIAVDKSPLLPGQSATFANYTSYEHGINGLIVDLLNPTAMPTAGDFTFRVGNDDDTATWQPAPPTESFHVDTGGGPLGATRVTVTWAGGDITGQWLETTIAASLTGTTDVFYYGNAVGETGNDPANALVTAADLIAIRDNGRGDANRADITTPHDIDRDRHVNAVDQLLARNAATGPFDALRLITP